MFVKPMTAPFQSSFCELLAATSHPAYGERASVFISHAWKYHFLDVVSALQGHFKDEPDIVIWFDMFSNNQHKAVDYDFSWWSTTFRSAIAEFNRTVMVLSPWNDPIPLTRAWCLFELWSTADTGAQFEVAMSQEGIESFLSDIVGFLSTSVATLQTMLTTINVERSEAFNPADKEKIMTAVKNTCGFAKLNKMVFEKMRDWAIQTLVDATFERQENGKLKDLVDYNHAQGLLHLGLGDSGSASSILRECYQQYTDWHGETDIYYTLKAFHSYIEAKLRLQDYKDGYNVEEDIAEVENMIETLLPKEEEDPGYYHPEVLKVKRHLALVYLQAGRVDDAQRLCSELAEDDMKDEKDKLLDKAIQGRVYLSSGNFEEAAKYFEDVHQTCLASLDRLHPKTLDALFDLSELWELQGKQEEAEKAFETILEQRRLIYGDNGNETYIVAQKLITLYEKQGKQEEAQLIRASIGIN
ncbi:tetratricopeptide repeat protein [archaeon]|nr:MAG: tetratricopeptide repeat protein [archaeon]